MVTVLEYGSTKFSIPGLWTQLRNIKWLRYIPNTAALRTPRSTNKFVYTRSAREVTESNDSQYSTVTIFKTATRWKCSEVRDGHHTQQTSQTKGG